MNYSGFAVTNCFLQEYSLFIIWRLVSFGLSTLLWTIYVKQTNDMWDKCQKIIPLIPLGHMATRQHMTSGPYAILYMEIK